VAAAVGVEESPHLWQTPAAVERGAAVWGTEEDEQAAAVETLASIVGAVDASAGAGGKQVS
jgi:hypothetical protein